MTSLITLALILLVAVIFVVVSLCLSGVHGVSLVEEWQSWFGIQHQVSEAVSTDFCKLFVLKM